MAPDTGVVEKQKLGKLSQTRRWGGCISRGPICEQLWDSTARRRQFQGVRCEVASTQCISGCRCWGEAIPLQTLRANRSWRYPISNGPGRFKIGFFFFFHGQFEMSDKLFGLTCCNALLRNTGLPNSIFSLSLFLGRIFSPLFERLLQSFDDPTNERLVVQGMTIGFPRNQRGSFCRSGCHTGRSPTNTTHT